MRSIGLLIRDSLQFSILSRKTSQLVIIYRQADLGYTSESGAKTIQAGQLQFRASNRVGLLGQMARGNPRLIKSIVVKLTSFCDRIAGWKSKIVIFQASVERTRPRGFHAIYNIHDYHLSMEQLNSPLLGVIWCLSRDDALRADKGFLVVEKGPL